MNIAEPIIRIERKLESLDALIDSVEKITENLNQVAQDLDKVVKCLDNLKEAYTKKCTTVELREKYRALTNEEFLNLYDSGKIHSIRKAGKDAYQARYVITNIYTSEECGVRYIYLNFNGDDFGYGLRYLFNKDFEYFDGESWQPFGMLKE